MFMGAPVIKSHLIDEKETKSTLFFRFHLSGVDQISHKVLYLSDL